MFPPIDPFASGMLAVGDGNEIYWETSGNPDGKPAIHVHGGPGSGIMTGYRRQYDPARYLIVSFEQRGCGRSRPLAAPGNLDTNTTAHLIADMEALRIHLGVDAWLVSGMSWGTTLALAYAQRHPDRVTELLLTLVTTTSAAEVEWTTGRMRNVFTREWERFAAASGAAPGERVVDAYNRRLRHPDPAVRADAASAWCTWEDVHVSLDPRHEPSPRFADAEFRLLFATLVVHYWSNAAFIDGGLLAGMGRVRHLPGTLIHGRLDVSSPLRTAWELHRAWPSSELVVIDDEGHGGDRLIEALVAAIARYS